MQATHALIEFDNKVCGFACRSEVGRCCAQRCESCLDRQLIGASIKATSCRPRSTDGSRLRSLCKGCMHRPSTIGCAESCAGSRPSGFVSIEPSCAARDDKRCCVTRHYSAVVGKGVRGSILRPNRVENRGCILHSRQGMSSTMQ